jgi:diacylglycerol kinase
MRPQPFIRDADRGDGFFRSRIKAFKYAFAGWWYVIRTQRNAWIHALVSVLVFLVGLWLGLVPLEWAVIILAIAMVWTAEFVNTALEAVVDLASPQQHYLAKVGKDVGAAAVLIAAVSSILIGLLIMGPALWEKISLLAGW